MKTIKLLLFSLLTITCYSQIDTVRIEISGNKILEINKSKKIFEFSETKYIKEKTINIDKSELLYLHLFDKNYKNNKYYNNIRKITIYYRNGTIKTYRYKSKNNLHKFNGNEIKKIKISKPGSPKISKPINC
tara:strand:- start:394 stop:789 length:396 start_codon:yes stop_codon:yes gene_type:complete